MPTQRNIYAIVVKPPPGGHNAPVGTIGEKPLRLGQSEELPDWLMACEGQVLIKSQWPELYDAIGDQYGERPEALTFRIPDKRVQVA